MILLVGQPVEEGFCIVILCKILFVDYAVEALSLKLE